MVGIFEPGVTGMVGILLFGIVLGMLSSTVVPGAGGAVGGGVGGGGVGHIAELMAVT